LGGIVRLDITAPQKAAALILFLLALRRTRLGPRIDVLVDSVGHESVRLQAWRGIFEALPHWAKYLDPLTGPAALAQADPDEREHARAELDALLAQHPEWAKALGLETDGG